MIITVVVILKDRLSNGCPGCHLACELVHVAHCLVSPMMSEFVMSLSDGDEDDDGDVLCVDKLSRLCSDVQSRHAESLQLNVNSPLYKKFAK